jgi:hypothetical protein
LGNRRSVCIYPLPPDADAFSLGVGDAGYVFRVMRALCLNARILVITIWVGQDASYSRLLVNAAARCNSHLGGVVVKTRSTPRPEHSNEDEHGQKHQNGDRLSLSLSSCWPRLDPY